MSPFVRNDRALKKTEVTSPVKLSLNRKNSRKITWKQVEEVLNADMDNIKSPRGTSEQNHNSPSDK
jgi:hypothetical protein